jgi:signal transduction histidine kinase
LIICGSDRPGVDAVATKPHIQLEALHELARALAGGEFRARAVLQRACAAVAEGFEFERVGIVRYVPETSTLVPFAGHGLTRAEVNALPAAVPVRRFGAFERALAAGEAIFVEEPDANETVPEEILRGLGIGSFVIVPLVSDGRCLGFMTCDERGERFVLEPAEVDLLSTFGTLIAAFLEKAIEHGELRRLNELKSQFAALASHELRTPAAAIYGAVRTLDEREAELDEEQRRALRRMLSQQSKRLFELVENLLDLSRLEADSIRISPVEVSVGERLRALVGSIFEADADLTINAPSDLSAPVDPQAFDRILSNLLVNALRHGAPPFVVSSAPVGRELWVTVEDRGRGIAADYVGSVFERFTRGATDASEGAGLGLSIAQSYARAHGGTLTYEPADPHGASALFSPSARTRRRSRVTSSSRANAGPPPRCSTRCSRAHGQRCRRRETPARLPTCGRACRRIEDGAMR